MKPCIRLALALVLAFPALAQIDTAILRPVGYHPGNIAYYNTPYFANALAQGGEWYSFTGTAFGTPIDFNTAQFENGYPKFLDAGQKLRAPIFGLHIATQFRPAAWPARNELARGRIVVTWKGNADVRLVNGTFVATGSSGASTGNLVDGRRIYLCTGASESTQSIEVHSIAAPITEIRVWLAPVDDPSTPASNENTTGSLEGHLFHPLLLQRIADADWAFIRFMDWGATNASPQQDWSDRRLPAHAFMNGVINARQPSAGVQGERETGVAFEHMVALCNMTGRNLWINIPHLATADFTTRLAKLIRFGSDGVNPYDAPQANPLHPPLNASLKVYVEFSNEIWSSGFNFPQGNWAQEQAALAGLTKPQFTARRFCDTWRIFQEVFGGTTRLVRVAAIFTAGSESYSRPFLQELAAYGPTLSPAVRPDVLAVTTYFGNGIQDYVQQQGFTTGKLFDDPYWTSPAFATHLQSAFEEWKRRILAGDSAAGSGPDATGIGGGFPASLRTLPNETLGYPLPLVAYEGGPSLFTDAIDQDATNGSGVPSDDGVTTFIEAMNRDPRIADVYRIHLDLARSKGLWTHTPYTDTSPWSRFGQWGHLESLDQPPASAPKYALMLEHFATFAALRPVDAPLGSVPQFTAAAILPAGIAGLFYTTDIATSGGDGARTVLAIGTSLDAGLSVAAGPTPGTLRVSGTPATSRRNYLLARVHDADGDPAWRIFTLETFGGPGTLVQSDFNGASPALHLPWTKTFVLSPKVSWSGWSAGAGITPRSGDNALLFSVSAPSAANETLAQSLADNEFLSATVTPGSAPLDLREAEVRFSTRRIGFHSPLGYALFSSVGGFTQANAHYVSSEVAKDDFDETAHVITLPATAAFSAISAPFELRVYAFGAQFDGHFTSLTGFKLTEKSSGSPPSAPGALQATATSTTQVELTWSGAAGAESYEIARMGNGSGEQIVGTSTTIAFSDPSAFASTAYRYRVRAVGAGGTSAFSTPDLATTLFFTTDPIIRRSHLIELRDAVNAVRATAGLPAQTWTDDAITPGVTKVRALHVTELRNALGAALTALGVPVPTFGGTLGTTVNIQASHFTELRTAVR